jgi:hypothetical protein
VQRHLVSASTSTAGPLLATVAPSAAARCAAGHQGCLVQGQKQGMEYFGAGGAATPYLPPDLPAGLMRAAKVREDCWGACCQWG